MVSVRPSNTMSIGVFVIRLPDRLALDILPRATCHQLRTIIGLAIGKPAQKRTVVVIEHAKKKYGLITKPKIAIFHRELAVIGHWRHSRQRQFTGDCGL